MTQRLLTIVIVLLSALRVPIALDAAKSGREFVVVIDAGHGGHDAGAPGIVTNEKTINLAVAMQLGNMLAKEKGVKVVYTRSTDRFVTLQGRADIANRAGGDLFVSIHANSVDAKAKNRTSVHGAAVYTLGLDRTDDNLAVAMRENSVMKLERDYSTTYQGFDPSSAESYIIFEMSQNKHMQQSVVAAQAVAKELAATAGRKNNGVRQANFWVLLKTAMPSMLVELDFICNPSEEKFMASKSGQRQLAEAIYNGVMSYRRGVNSVADNDRRSEAAADEARQQRPDRRPVYKIQFLTSPKKLREGCRDFKGLTDVDSYFDKGMNKYTFGVYESASAAASELAKVRTLFPDAFVIKTVGGRRVP